ncbi:MAG TPA: hypothetical protein VD931_21720 [Baekduia sp.]|nr:hypothetical protein [Baekduia sp.]
MGRLDTATTATNAGMVAFDVALGTGAIAAPDATLRLLGHTAPSPDARRLFQRCGPIWLTFAAAHLTAAVRGAPQDWWALAWLRATEIATDALWSSSPAIPRRSARAALCAAGAANLAMTLAFARRSRQAA